MGFNTLKNSHYVKGVRYSNNIINDTVFESLCKALFDKEDELLIKYAKLNKERKANLIRAYDEKLISRFENDGYLSLNTFADVYRQEIKIDYNTLYKRILEKGVIAEYLVNKGYIFTYKRVKKDGELTKRAYTIVNHKKYKEFIDCITRNFLNEDQRNSTIDNIKPRKNAKKK